MKLKFFLIGSCYSGCMFKDKILGNLTNGNFDLVYQHQHDSLISIMTDPVEMNLEGVKSEFQWDFNHFAESIFRKDIFEKMKQFQPDYLIYDTYAEGICPIIEMTEESYLTQNYYIQTSDINEKLKGKNVLMPFSEKRWNLFKKYSLAFFEKIKHDFPKMKIILVRSRAAETLYLDSMHTSIFKNAESIRQQNAIRERCDQFILEHVSGVRELCMLDEYVSASKEPYENYKYSVSSNHFNIQYYRDEYSKLQQIIIADMLGGKENTKYFNQAICILATGDFPLLLLQAKIYKDFFQVYIHIPSNVIGDKFTQVQIEKLRKIPNVTVIAKYNIYKGSFNELRALLELSDMAFSNEKIKYVHYTSDQDLPIRPINVIYNYFEKTAGGKSFLNCHANGDRNQMEKLADSTFRYYYYFYNQDENDPIVKEQIKDSLEFQKGQGIYRKSIGEFSDLYKGVIWGSINRDAYLYCMHYTKEHPEYLRDIKYTRLRTEFFFHTILYNTPSFSEKLEKSSRGGKHGWFWDDKASAFQWLDINLYNKLKMDENVLFARKVSSQNKDLINTILKDIGSPYTLEFC